MKQNYKLIIAYDGTRYYGWERQPGTEMTIQGKLEQALGRMAGHPVELTGAGRTDAGVHAKGMVANVRLALEAGMEEKGNPQLYEPLPAGGYLRPGSKKSF